MTCGVGCSRRPTATAADETMRETLVPARHPRNMRLDDAIDQWALCYLSQSPASATTTTTGVPATTPKTKPYAPSATDGSASSTTASPTTNTPLGANANHSSLTATPLGYLGGLQWDRGWPADSRRQVAPLSESAQCSGVPRTQSGGHGRQQVSPWIRVRDHPGEVGCEVPSPGRNSLAE